MAGQFIARKVLETIDRRDTFVADITRLNFNVTFELGFAIGRRKPVLLVRNSALVSSPERAAEVGVYDTIGYESYANSESLATLLRSLPKLRPLETGGVEPDRRTPVFVVLPGDSTDFEIRLISRIKKARLFYRSFDAAEQVRLSAFEAIDQVARSFGVAVPLLSANRIGQETHNLRAAFVAGLAMGLGRACLILQLANDPVPMDVRDFVARCGQLENVNQHVADFAPLVAEQLQSDLRVVRTDDDSPLIASVSLGQSAAENEFQEIDRYYIEIDEYQRALRGELQVVTGRKGSGKTALFGHLRNRLRRDKRKVVLDLKPEGYQLREFSEALARLSQATRGHVVAAFWDYLLQLEIASKLLQKDQHTYQFNHTIRDLYLSLKDEYLRGEHHAEGDFAERLSSLASRIGTDLQQMQNDGTEFDVLSTQQITELLYKHDIARLRKILQEYLSEKDGAWLLFDNLDKGWPAFGIGETDLLLIEGLIEAVAKMRREFGKADIDFVGIVFLRNDAYELLLDHMPDRGKISRANLDWSEPDLFREMLRRRIVVNEGVDSESTFEHVWAQLCESHIDGEESSQYLIDRCLMRPRGLLELVGHCRAHAVNLRHEKILAHDVRAGETAYSTEMVQSINFEIRDVYPQAEGIMYELIEESAWIESSRLEALLEQKGIRGDDLDRVCEFLLWYGVLGILRQDGSSVFIYDVRYDAQKLAALARREQIKTFRINPAFWAGLETKDRDS